jgi:hypothetical protein
MLPFLLWFVAGLGLAAIGWVISVTVGENAAGVVVLTVVVVANAASTVWSGKPK